MSKKSRFSATYAQEQVIIRKTIKDAPGQAGGLPALTDRVEAIEEVISLRVHGT